MQTEPSHEPSLLMPNSQRLCGRRSLGDYQEPYQEFCALVEHQSGLLMRYYGTVYQTDVCLSADHFRAEREWSYSKPSIWLPSISREKVYFCDYENEEAT